MNITRKENIILFLFLRKKLELEKKVTFLLSKKVPIKHGFSFSYFYKSKVESVQKVDVQNWSNVPCVCGSAE